MRRSFHCLLVLFCWLFPQALPAQEKSPRTCRLLFLGAADTDPESLQLHDGSKCREVELPRMNLSKVYPIPAGALTLRMLTTPPAEGEAPLASAPSVQLAETVGDFYLLVAPDASNKNLPLRLQVIPTGGEQFKPGHMLWYNLTIHDVGGKVGKQKLALKARSKMLLEPPADALDSYPVNLSYRIPGKEAPYPLCETRWNHDPAARWLVFVINEPGSRAPRVLGFPDRRDELTESP